jgi:hypothetical protein
MASELARKYHSITFKKTSNGQTVTKNTWDDWHLIPSSRPMFMQPTPLYKYVDIPGRDGQLDTTDYLIGRPTYSDRKGAFEFFIQNGNRYYESVRASLASYFDGSKILAYLEDDYNTSAGKYNYCYQGRFVFKGWTPGKDYSQVSIEYQVGPYRMTETNAGLKEAGL